MSFSSCECSVREFSDPEWLGLVTWGLVPSIGYIVYFYNGKLVIVTMLFLGCPLFSITPVDDLELLVQVLKVLDKVEG